jgi:hypothetical protein
MSSHSPATQTLPAPLQLPHAERRARIAEWMRLFVEPGQVVELRVIAPPVDRKANPHAKYTSSGWFDFDHIDDLAHEAAHYSGADGFDGVYFTPNPVKPEVLKRRANFFAESKIEDGSTGGDDIAERRWLMIDVDATRGAGGKGQSSSEVEKDAALEVGQSVHLLLMDLGWGLPAINVDSGNGYHLYYALHPTDRAVGSTTEEIKASTAKFKHLLELIAGACDTAGASVDSGIGDPSRVMKVPGTLSRKGVNTEERPWRVSQLLSTNDQPTHPPTIEETIKAMEGHGIKRKAKADAKGEDAEAKSKRKRKASPLPTFSCHTTTPYGQRSLQEECQKIASAPEDTRNITLNACSFAIYQLVAGGEINEIDAEGGIVAAARSLGLPDPEIFKTMRSAAAKGKTQPRSAPVREANGDASPIPASVLGGEQPVTTPAANPSSNSSDQPRRPIHALPEVYIDPEESRVVDEILPHLAKDPDLYLRNGQFVRVQLNKKTGISSITEVTQPDIRRRITERVALKEIKISKESGDRSIVFSHPPVWLPSMMVDHPHKPGFREIIGIINAPIVRKDGSICDTVGFDATTGLYSTVNRASIDAAKAIDFSKESAIRSANALADLIADFPIVETNGISVFLSAILSLIGRHLIDGNIPLHLVDANAAGSGKGKLIDIAGIIATGSHFPVQQLSTNIEEQRKNISSQVLAGTTALHLDNAESGSVLKSTVMDSIITSRYWSDRRLGSNDLDTDFVRTVFFLSGNNISLGGDTSRRVIRIRLESKTANPEDRHEFKHRRIMQHVTAHRRTYLAHAITMLASYLRSSSPPFEGLRETGSFEEWSDVIRECIIWSGMPDPWDSNATVKKELNSTSDEHALVVAAWKEICEGGSLTVAEAATKYKDNSYCGETRFTAMASLILLNFRGDFNARSLGKLLAKYKNLPSQEGTIVTSGKDNHTKNLLWSVR